MIPEKPPTQGEIFLKAVTNFPKYIVGWVLGLIQAVLADLHMTTLAITGVAVGFALSSVTAGVAAFFVAYTLSRIVSNHADAVAFSSNNNRAGLESLAQAWRDDA